MKFTVNENSNNYRRVKRSLWGDSTGKIKTFAIISPMNPLGLANSNDEEAQKKYNSWIVHKQSGNTANQKELKKYLMTTDDIIDRIQKTGDETLRYGRFNYTVIKGHYGEAEKSFIIYNIPFADAKIIAQNYGQESFFYGNVYADHSKIAYYKTEDGCKTYKLVEISDTITDETDAENYFSKFGFKFRINMQEFGDDVTPIVNNGEFEESMNENRTFMSRALHRGNCYRNS